MVLTKHIFTAIATSPFSFYKLNSTIRVWALDFGLWDLTYTLFLRLSRRGGRSIWWDLAEIRRSGGRSPWDLAEIWTPGLRFPSTIWKNGIEMNATPTPFASQTTIAKECSADANWMDMLDSTIFAALDRTENLQYRMTTCLRFLLRPYLATYLANLSIC